MKPVSSLAFYTIFFFPCLKALCFLSCFFDPNPAALATRSQVGVATGCIRKSIMQLLVLVVA